jgi:NAD+ diphosphatase
MPEEATVCWLLRHQNALVVVDPTGAGDFPRHRREDLPTLRNVLPVGEWRGLACLAAELDELPTQWVNCLVPLRQVFTLMGMDAFMLAGRGVQLLDWQHNHRFCGACATPTERNVGELAMRCPACGLLAYPRLSPAVMVLVTRGDELLLARSPRFPPGVFSALAGFVEPGETLEQCAAREVREEVGLEIANLRYFGSQPWPFPNSLMVAFIADYAGGELKPDGVEIEMAAWFAADELPTLPVPMSIAHRLIADWVERRRINSP